MKRTALALLMVTPLTVFAQFGVGIHQSNLSFVGLNYEIKERHQKV